MKVKPIPTEYVKRIKDWTRANPRNYALFVIGINTGLRASDLVRLRLSDFWNGRFKHYLIIKQHKTGRNVKIAINQPVVAGTTRMPRCMPTYSTQPSGATGEITKSPLRRITSGGLFANGAGGSGCETEAMEHTRSEKHAAERSMNTRRNPWAWLMRGSSRPMSLAIRIRKSQRPILTSRMRRRSESSWRVPCNLPPNRF